MLDRSPENRCSDSSCAGNTENRGATGCSCANTGGAGDNAGGGIVRAKPGAVSIDRTEDTRDRAHQSTCARVWIAATHHDQDRTQAASVERLWGATTRQEWRGSTVTSIKWFRKDKHDDVGSLLDM